MHLIHHNSWYNHLNMFISWKYCRLHPMTRKSWISVYVLSELLKFSEHLKVTALNSFSFWVKWSPKSVEAVLELIFYNPPSFLCISSLCTNFLQPPNVFKGLVGVLIKCWERVFKGQTQPEFSLFALYLWSLVITERAVAEVYFFNSNLWLFLSRSMLCASTLQAYTVELHSYAVLCCCCWTILETGEMIESSWSSNNESLYDPLTFILAQQWSWHLRSAKVPPHRFYTQCSDYSGLVLFNLWK